MNMPGESLPQQTSPELRTIVEIGAGRIAPTDVVVDGKPYWQAVPEYRTFGADERYIGVDLGSRTMIDRPPRGPGMTEADVTAKWKAMLAPHDHNMYVNWARIKAEQPESSITFLHADATALPLPNESADEVIASNVFGRGVDDVVLPLIYTEAMRVLKPTGKLIVHDSVSPEFIGPNSLPRWIRNNSLAEPSSTAWYNFSTNYYAFIEIAEKYGFYYSKPWRDTPEAIERVKYQNRESTIWILGRAAITEPAPITEPPVTQPSPEQPPTQAVIPETPESAYERWKQVFGKLFPGSDNH